MQTEIRITILGDICPTEDYRMYFKENHYNLFGAMQEKIRKSDFSICNLECPATSEDKPIVKTGPNLKANPEIIRSLKNVGIDAISIANNHILDYGVKGLMDTIEYSKENNLRYFGGGENLCEASKPLIVKLKNKTVGFMSYAEHEFNIATKDTAGANLFDPLLSLKQISEIKQQVDFLIILYHGGIEHYKYPSPLLQKKCHAMVDFGADVVLCQHSHCIGTRETYNGAEIVYGQGNSIFGYRAGDEAWNQGLIVEIVITDNGLDVLYSLIEATEKGMILPKETMVSRIIQFEKDSQKIYENDFLIDKWNEFCREKASLYMPMLFGWSRIVNKLNRIFNNQLFNIFVKHNKKMITMNLIRCDAHKEVIQTYLQNEVNIYKS